MSKTARVILAERLGYDNIDKAEDILDSCGVLVYDTLLHTMFSDVLDSFFAGELDVEEAVDEMERRLILYFGEEKGDIAQGYTVFIAIGVTVLAILAVVLVINKAKKH